MVVFDGVGRDEQFGPLEVRFAAHADAVLERLAAEHRDRERVCLISSDAAVRGTSGQEVAKISSREFASTLESVEHSEDSASRVRDRLTPRRATAWNASGAPTARPKDRSFRGPAQGSGWMGPLQCPCNVDNCLLRSSSR